MPGSVSRLPNGNTDGSDDGTVPPAEVYKVAVEEYRFQATFNWSRTQYLLAFNAVILAAAVGLSPHGGGAALLYLFGALVSLLCQQVITVQHGYYRAARDRMRRVEASLDIPETQRTDTTSTLGGRRRRVSVNDIARILLAGLTAANIAGTLVVLIR